MITSGTSKFIRGENQTKPEHLSTETVDSLEQLQRLTADAKRAEYEAQQARSETQRLEREAATRRQLEESETIAALADRLEVPASYAGAAIAARLPTLNGSVRPIFESILAAMQNGASRIVIGEALHCLAAGGAIPKIAADDKFFGPSKALRELPAFKPEPYAQINVCDWLQGWTASTGIPFPARPHVDFEQEHEWNARIHLNLDKNRYSANHDENHRLGALEKKLMRERRRQLDDAADIAHHHAREELRAKLLSVIDPVVAALPFGVSYWWARDFRRVIAREPSRSRTPMLHADHFEAWRQTQILGIKFRFEQLK